MERQPERDPFEDEMQSAKHEMAEMKPEQRPRIWVGCQAAYNSGTLHGDWIDAAQEPSEIISDIRTMLRGSPVPYAEGWCIFDWQNFGTAHIDEHEAIERISALACGIQEHGLAFSAWTEFAGTDGRAREMFDDFYRGHWDSATEFAEHLVEGHRIDELLNKQVPDLLKPYVFVDAGAWARDMIAYGYIDVVDAPGGGVWIFQLAQ